MEKGIPQNKTSNLAFHNIKRFFSKLIQYSFLLILFVSLAGHENINPLLGESYVDFYTSECQHLLEINAKALTIHSSTDSSSLNFKLQEMTNEFYRQRNYLPAWTINYAGAEQLENLIRITDSAEYLGFPKFLINSNLLISRLDLLESNTFGEGKIGERIDLELEATQAAFRIMIYLHNGIIKEDTSANLSSFLEQLPTTLNTSIENNVVEESILSVQPSNTIYKNLLFGLSQFLNAYRAVSNPSYGISKSLLSEILYYAEILDSNVFDSINTVEKSIREFQNINEIDASGELNKATVDKMAEVLSNKYNLIALNLDRLRKSNINCDDYILVNIPEYKLHVFSDGVKEKIFNVVVGQRRTPTPILSSRLEKIITNPYWTVPRSIAKNEMLSKIRNDSSFLQRNGYFIINGLEETIHDTIVEWNSDDPLGKKYWIRQNKGGGNALGKVKFVFPNDFRVYLHDTPSKRLFKKKRRAFSHGCIRVQNPEELAQYLSDKYYAPDNDSVNIKSAIAKRRRNEILISRNVEIHLQYLTCSIDSGNRLIFYKDIYNKDKKEMQKLFSTNPI